MYEMEFLKLRMCVWWRGEKVCVYGGGGVYFLQLLKHKIMTFLSKHCIVQYIGLSILRYKSEMDISESSIPFTGDLVYWIE